MSADGGSLPESAENPARPRILCETAALDGASAGAGAMWRLAEPGRQLDANVVRIPPTRCVETHYEPDVDVLLLVTAGGGTLGSPDGPQALSEGSLAWLPRRSTRSLAAGDQGMTYLTVHRRRGGMRIQPPPGTPPLIS